MLACERRLIVRTAEAGLKHGGAQEVGVALAALAETRDWSLRDEQDPNLLYNLACGRALGARCGGPDSAGLAAGATDALRHALARERGPRYRLAASAARDPDLADLREGPLPAVLAQVTGRRRAVPGLAWQRGRRFARTLG